MEEQITAPIIPPRIVLKRTSVNKKIGWEIASSSHKDKEELLEIVKMFEEVNENMEEKFGNTIKTKLEGVKRE